MNAPDRRAVIVASVLVAAIVAGCSPGSSSAAPTSGPPSLAVSVPPVASQAPGGPQEPCALNDGKFCDLAPGAYRSTAFEGGVTFTLSQHWTNTDNAPDLIAMFDEGDIVAGRSWLEIIGGPVSEGAETAPYATVGDLVGALDAIDGLTITSVQGRDFGADPAQVYDVVHTGADEVILFTYAETIGQYYLAPGVTIRIYWLDIGGRPVLVTAEAATDSFSEFMSAVEPFLASVEFGD